MGSANFRVSVRPSDGGYDNTKSSQMGTALAVGNFNNDAYDDLAVGLPGAEVNGQAAAGAVFVYLGSASGLSAFPFPLTQVPFGGLAEGGDRFGAALATGHLGTDVYGDIAIGSPGENSSAGAVFFIFGYPSGVNTNQTLALDSAAIGLAPQAAAGLGSALAIGNVRRGGQAELIIGAPDTDIGAVLNAGLVHIIRGNAAGLNLADRLSIDMTATGQPLEANARFGFSFAVGNFDGGLDGVQDVAIGIPGMFGGAGRVLVATGSATADPTFSTLLYQTNAAEPGGPEAGDDFGWGLAAGDFTGDGIDDLAVGAPGEDVLDSTGAPVSNSGWVNIHDGSATGLSSQREESHGEAYFSDAPNGPASLGVAVAFGKTSANQRQSLLAAAPVRNGDTGQVYDFAPWRQVPALECRTAMCADCAGNIIYALKPFEHVKIASTTKIMTVLLGCEATARPANDPFRVALDEEILIPTWLANEFGPDSACSIFLYAPFGDRHSFYEVMRECVMVSGNDSAHVIANTITDEANAWNGHAGPEPTFVTLMNARAARIGMGDTFFTNPPGVDTDDPYSSAYDMWLLAHTAMQNPLFRGIVWRHSVCGRSFRGGRGGGLVCPEPLEDRVWLARRIEVARQAHRRHQARRHAWHGHDRRGRAPARRRSDRSRVCGWLRLG